MDSLTNSVLDEDEYTDLMDYLEKYMICLLTEILQELYYSL